MIEFSHDEHFIYLRNVPSRDKSMMELFHNAVWSNARRHWRLPKTHYVCIELWNTFPQLRTNERFIRVGKECKDRFNSLLQLRQTITAGGDHDKRLRPYQVEDALYLSSLEAGGVFNEPRTGKTPTTIYTMCLIGGLRNIAIVPASLVPNWIREIGTWWPEAKAFDYAEQYEEFLRYKGASVLVISKDRLRRDVDKIALDFDCAIVDEAHFLRNYNTAQSKAVYKIARRSRRRYALTGTPAVSHAADIIGIFMFLYPNQYPSYWQAVNRYFTTYEVQYARGKGIEIGNVKSHRRKELQEIKAIYSTQRKREEVMPWLPEKQYETLTCKMSKKQEKYYKQMLNEFMASDLDIEDVADGDLNRIARLLDSGNVVDAPNTIVQLMRLRQLSIDPRLVGFDEVGAKTKTIIDFLTDQQEPIVIMSMFTSYLKLLAEDLKKLKLKVGMVHGQMSNKDKDEAVEAFQNGRLDVLLCNIISAGVGFTLDRSNAVLFCDRAWTPAENAQAEDRVCPTSEERNHAHIIYDIICEESVDSRIHRLLKQKKSLTDIINEVGIEALLKEE